MIIEKEESRIFLENTIRITLCGIQHIVYHKKLKKMPDEKFKNYGLINYLANYIESNFGMIFIRFYQLFGSGN